MDVRKRSHRRRRRTEYDSDEDSSGSEPEYLDEQEQEQLIKVLRDEDAKGNARISNIILFIYTLFLVTIPLVSDHPSTTIWTTLTLLPQFLTAYSIRYINLPPSDSLPTANTFSSSARTAAPSLRSLSEFCGVRQPGFLFLFGASLMLGMVRWYRWECWGPLVLVVLCGFADLEARSVNVEELEVRRYSYKGA